MVSLGLACYGGKDHAQHVLQDLQQFLQGCAQHRKQGDFRCPPCSAVSLLASFQRARSRQCPACFTWQFRSKETEVYHPCFAKGYIYTPKFSYNTARFNAIKAVSHGAPRAHKASRCHFCYCFRTQVDMQGTSDFSQCEQLIKRIFNKNAPCLVAQCSPLQQFRHAIVPALWQFRSHHGMSQCRVQAHSMAFISPGFTKRSSSLLRHG